MNEQLPKEDVSLDDLKSVIEAVHRLRTQGICHETELRVAERDAWRTAANFIVQYVNVGGNGYREFMEGINIIREKLS